MPMVTEKYEFECPDKSILIAPFGLVNFRWTEQNRFASRMVDHG